MNAVTYLNRSTIKHLLSTSPLLSISYLKILFIYRKSGPLGQDLYFEIAANLKGSTYFLKIALTSMLFSLS